MKKKLWLVILPLILSTSCMNQKNSNSINDKSPAQSTKETQYELVINQKEPMFFSKEGNAYVLKDVILHKEDTILIQKEDGSKYTVLPGFDFCIVENDEIRVRVDGKYDITLSGTSLRLNRKESAYEKFRLRIGEEWKDARKADEYTFRIENVHLRFRQSFQLYLDDKAAEEKDVELTDSVDFRDGTFKAQSEGNFTFLYDARKKIEIQVEDEIRPAEVEKDKSDYERLLSKLKEDMKSSSRISGNKTTGSGNDKTTAELKQENHLNESAYSKTEKNADGDIVSDEKITKCYDNDGYYSFQSLDGNFSLLEAKTFEKAQFVNDQNYYKVSQDLIELDDAKSQVAFFQPFSSEINSLLSSLLFSSHLPSSNPMDEEEKKLFEDSFTLRNEYIGDTGFDRRLIATSFERAKGEATSSAVRNEATLTIDKDGKVCSGEITISYYESSKNLLQEDYSLSSQAKIAAKETTAFEIDDSPRTEKQNLEMDPEDYIADANDIVFAPTVSVTAGGNPFDVQDSILSLSKPLGINKSDFRVMAYDQNYFTAGKGNDKILYTGTRGGSTVVYVGNRYSKVLARLVVEIVFGKPTSCSILDDKDEAVQNGSSFEAGTSFEFKVKVPSGQNPSFQVTSEDESVISVLSCSTKEEAEYYGFTNVKLNFISVGSSTIRIQSISNPELVRTLQLNVIKPASMETYQGHYYCNSSTSLEIKENGEALLTSSDGKTYEMKLKLEKNLLVLASSDTVEYFEATIETYNSRFSLSKLSSIAVSLKDGKDFGYVPTLYQGFSLFENKTLKDTNASLEIQNYKVTYGTSKFHGVLKDGEHTLEFDFAMNSTSECDMDSNYILDGENLSYNLTFRSSDVSREKLDISFGGQGYFDSKSYHFVPDLD